MSPEITLFLARGNRRGSGSSNPVRSILEDADHRLSGIMREILSESSERLKFIEARLHQYELQIERLFRQLSYLPLRSSWQIPQFLLRTARIMSQLQGSRGLLGYSLRAELGAKRFWTLSAWQDEVALQAFVRARPHSQTMKAMASRTGPTKFIRWTVKGSELPVSWNDAFRRGAEN